MSIPRTGLWNIQRPADLPRASAAHLADGGPLEITQSGGGGDDTLTGTDNRDRLNGLGGDDLIDGGAGADILIGGTGNDTVHGGEDDDAIWALYIGNSDSPDSVDEIYGEGGDDDLQGSSGTDLLRGGFGDDLARGFDGDDFLSGNDGADILIGDAGADRLLGGDGNDSLEGGDDADSDDSLSGGQGEDTLVGGSNSGLFDGGAGNDHIDGGGTLIGGDGDDLILGDGVVSGGSGDDVIETHGGRLDGGAGADRFFVRGQSEIDGGGQPDGAADYLNLDQWDAGRTSSFNLAECADGVVQTIGATTVVNIERAAIRFVTADAVTGGAFDDILRVLKGSPTINGGAGDDLLQTFKGGSLLVGGDGDDDLAALGRPADTLIGGRGADYLAAGRGEDTYVYTSAKDSVRAASDTISGMSALDILDLAAIDADTSQAGDQAFVLVSELTGEAGQLTVHYDADDDRSYILGDVDGDGRSDLCITTFRDASGFDNFVL